MTTTSKNDPNRRMWNVVGSAAADFPDHDLVRLDPQHYDAWIASLRDGEASVRKLRKRLEALRDGVDRQCQSCGRPVAGRADAKFCSSACRVRAHHGRRRAASGGPT